MKRTTKLTSAALVLFFITLVFSSCTKDTPADVIYVIKGNAAPTAVTNASPAFGTINGGYSATYKKIAFNINWYNLSSAPTGTSFYFGDSVAGNRKIKSFAVTEGNENGLTASEMFLSEGQVQSLLKGEWYYTVNTVDHPEGEVAGKLMVLKTE